MDTTNYYGVLGHDGANITDVGNWRLAFLNRYNGTASGNSQTNHSNGQTFGIVGDGANLANELGYSLYEVDKEEPLDYSFDKVLAGQAAMDLIKSSGNSFAEYEEFKVGCVTFGKYLDFPVAPDLNVSLGYDYSGVKSQKTISGEELTQINYHGSPNWGYFAPWTHIDTSNYNSVEEAMQSEDYKQVRRNGRRSFKVSFSYIDKTDMFPKNFEGSMSGDYEPITPGENTGFTWDEDDNIIGSFLNFTLGGQIPFIFQPDNTKQDFAICRLDKSASNIKQVAPGVYSISMTFVETW